MVELRGVIVGSIAAGRIGALRKTAEHLAAQPKKQDGVVVEMPSREAASK
jgi:hypothetical protein